MYFFNSILISDVLSVSIFCGLLGPNQCRYIRTRPTFSFHFISVKEITQFQKSWKKMFVYKIHELQIYV